MSSFMIKRLVLHPIVARVATLGAVLIVAAVVGGLIGSTLGAKRFNSMTLRRVLAVVLLFAAVKLIVV